MTQPIPQEVALGLQLATIAGNEPPSSYLEIRPLDREGRPVSGARSFEPVRKLRTAVAKILALRDDLNVFVGAAPRVRPEGTAAAVERVSMLWADCDTRESLAALCAFWPRPAIIVRTGATGNVHAYWPISRGLPPEYARRANLRLAGALGADTAATDPARVLRAIATCNQKSTPPAPVECVRLEPLSFDLADVVGSLPDDPRYGLAPRVRAPRAPDTSTGALEGAARVVREAEIGERNTKLNWASFRLGERVAAGELGAKDVREELLSASIQVGLTKAEAERTIHSGLTTAAPRAAV